MPMSPGNPLLGRPLMTSSILNSSYSSSTGPVGAVEDVGEEGVVSSVGELDREFPCEEQAEGVGGKVARRAERPFGRASGTTGAAAAKVVMLSSVAETGGGDGGVE